MRTKNAVSLIGMVGNDVEVRQANGVSYARFSLATCTGGYKKQDGTQVPEKTQWHNVVVWRNLAEFAGKWVKKGMKVAVDGMSVPQSQQPEQQAAQPQPAPVQQGYSSGGYQQAAQPVQQMQQVQNNMQQGGYQEQALFPSPVGSDGLPF